MQYFVVSARLQQSLIVTVLQCRIVSVFYEILQLRSMKIAILVVDCNGLARFTLFLQTEDIFSHLDSLKDRKSVVLGKSVDLGGRRIIKKKKSVTTQMQLVKIINQIQHL